MYGQSTVAGCDNGQRLHHFFSSLSKLIPCRLTDTIELRPFLPSNGDMLEDLYQNIFSIPANLANPQRKTYLDQNCFTIMVFNHQRAVGFLILSVEDWQTIYLRSTGLLEEFRGRGIYSNVLRFLLMECENLMLKFSIEVANDNYHHIHILNNNRFAVCALQQDTSWGTLIKFRKDFSTKQKVKEEL